MVDIVLKWFCVFRIVVVMKVQLDIQYLEYVQDLDEVGVEQF